MKNKNLSLAISSILTKVGFTLIILCCFAASLIFIYFGFIRYFALFIVVAAAFFGLILRVVKNVFEQAIEIREENDFTI